MKTTKVVALVALLIVILGACGNQTVQSVPGMPGFSKSADSGDRRAGDGIMKDKGGGDYRPGEILVKFKPGVAREAVDRIAGDHGLKMIRLVSPPGLYLFQIPEEGFVKEAIQRLNKLAEVEYSEPNYTRR